MPYIVRQRPVVSSTVIVIRIRPVIISEGQSTIVNITEELRNGVSRAEIQTVRIALLDACHHRVVLGCTDGRILDRHVTELRIGTIPLRAMLRRKDRGYNLIDR